MKKLISLLVVALLITLFVFLLVGCEIGVHPIGVPTSKGTHICVNNVSPYSSGAAYYCGSDCCYYQFYDDGGICEEVWCYDHHYCNWKITESYCY